MVAYSSFSYSEIVNGTTLNAAERHQWVMTNVLPQQAGLEVNGVVYRYTVMKQTQDDMLVSIQNKDALGSGNVFQQQDDWSGIPQNTITRVVPVNNVPIQRWGDGSISVEGTGRVVDPLVTYTYRYDTCFNPITDPTCPGYAEAMAAFLKDNGLDNAATDVVDPLEDENVQSALNNKTKTQEEDKEKQKRQAKLEEEAEKKAKRRKQASAVADNVVASALAISQDALLAAMNNVPKFEAYYTVIPGGAYADAANYKPTVIPENKGALRVGLAQQLLHDKLVGQQYQKP